MFCWVVLCLIFYKTDKTDLFLFLDMFSDIHQYVNFRQSLLVRQIGPDGYPAPQPGYGDYSHCVKPVAPEDWLATFTNSIDKVFRTHLH
jgi:hypothetical protein